MSVSDWVVLAVGVGQCVVAVLALHAAVRAGRVAKQQLEEARRQLQEAEQQRRQAMSLQYVERYWAISDDLLHSPKGSEEHRRHQHRYLLLCEDEFEAVKGGWLAPDMWDMWHRWLATPRGQSLLHVDLKACGHSAAPFENLRQCLEGPVDHTWRECPARADCSDRPVCPRESPDDAVALAIGASAECGVSSAHPPERFAAGSGRAPEGTEPG